MSQDYGIDNEGTGFGFDDDEDMEQLFKAAANAAEPGDDTNDSHLSYVYDDNSSPNEQVSSDDEQDIKHNVSESEAWHVVPDEEYVESEVIVHEVPTYDDNVQEITNEEDSYEKHEDFVVDKESEYQAEEENTYSNDRRIYSNSPSVEIEEHSYEEEKQAPVQPKRYGTHRSAVSADPKPSTPEPIVEQANSSIAETQDSTVKQQRRFNIPTEAEDIAHAQKVIRILDVYRGLNSQNMVAQLIYNDNEVDHTDEARLVVQVLRADPILSEMMTALREAALEKDRVERVFYVLRLDTHILNYLGDFLTTIVGAEFDNSNDQIGFAKEIETVINELDSKIVQIVADAQSVLSASQE